MEKLSLRKAIMKFYTGIGWFTLDKIIDDSDLINVLRCNTPLTRNRVRDEVTGMIREGVVLGKSKKENGETIYKIDGLPRRQTTMPQFSMSMRIALGLTIPQ